MMFSSKNVALILGETQTKARRWVKEFLPPDSEKGLHSGKTRKHELNEVFRVFLGGYMVCRMGFSVADAKMIIKDLSPWLKRKGLLPLGTSKDSSIRTLENPVVRYDVYIMLTGTPFVFFYECRGLIRELQELKGPVKSEYTSDRFAGNHVAAVTPIVDHIRILPISMLLHRFDAKLSCSTSFLKQ